MDHAQPFRIDTMAIVRELAALPHRGATTANEKRAAELLARALQALGARVERQPFKTAKTYISEVWWLLGALSLTLILTPFIAWIAFALMLLITATALRYFDWRSSPLSLLPPRAVSENILGKDPHEGKHDQGPQPGLKRKKLILMAHYDSAPVSLLYQPPLVKDFRRSLLCSLGLMAGAVLITLLEVLGMGRPITAWARWLLVAYFLVQGILSTIDYLRYGFANGAADNATGVAVALAGAERLWRDPIAGWEVEVVLTGAEEVGMVGARQYFLAQKDRLDANATYVMNFDNLGSGAVKIITRTGSMTTVVYDNALVHAALQTAAADPQYRHIKTGVWHTGDFDSIWFARAGIPSLTIAAQDEQGQIPFLHRPNDTIDNVDANVARCAVGFAEATIRRLAASV
jgi:hypothetical protein